MVVAPPKERGPGFQFDVILQRAPPLRRTEMTSTDCARLCVSSIRRKDGAQISLLSLIQFCTPFYTNPNFLLPRLSITKSENNKTSNENICTTKTRSTLDSTGVMYNNSGQCTPFTEFNTKSRTY